MPATSDDYIHRIGRTGRVERKGDAVTFVTKADESRIRELEKLLKCPLERLALPGFDYGKPAAGRHSSR